jgi:hydrogenase maturation protease
MPKSEGNPKSEIRNPKPAPRPSDFGLRNSFGFRISDFGFGPPCRFLIAGVGNVLLSDDGVGVHAVRELMKEPIPGVVLADIGTAVLHGLSFLETAGRVLVVDAAQGGQAPGTIYLFDADAAPVPGPFASMHAMGLLEAMRLLPPGLPRPAVTVLGVEPASLAYGLELSAPVQAALPRVVALARETVAGWSQDAPSVPLRASAIPLSLD